MVSSGWICGCLCHLWAIPGGIDFSRLVLCVIGEHDQAREVLASIRDLGSVGVPAGEPPNTVFLVPLSDIEYF